MATGDPLLDFAVSVRGGLLTLLMRAVSDGNSQYAYLVLVPLVYWVLSRRAGLLLLVADAAGTFAAVYLKGAVGMARPPDAGETAWLARADGNGFPSGHTTAAATTWSSLAAIRKSLRLAAFGAAVTGAVAFSRLYLGVHYTMDVLGGAAIGLSIGLLLLGTLPTLEHRFAELARWQRYGCAAALPALLALNASNEAIAIVCATAGAAVGHLAANELGWTVTTGHPKGLPAFGLVRLALGLPALAVLALGLGSPSESAPLALAFRFLALGLFVTLLGPKLFLLAESRWVSAPRPAAPVT